MIACNKFVETSIADRRHELRGRAPAMKGLQSDAVCVCGHSPAQTAVFVSALVYLS
jgi:hypothetical protein